MGHIAIYHPQVCGSVFAVTAQRTVRSDTGASLFPRIEFARVTRVQRYNIVGLVVKPFDDINLANRRASNFFLHVVSPPGNQQGPCRQQKQQHTPPCLRCTQKGPLQCRPYTACVTWHVLHVGYEQAGIEGLPGLQADAIASLCLGRDLSLVVDADEQLLVDQLHIALRLRR